MRCALKRTVADHSQSFYYTPMSTEDLLCQLAAAYETISEYQIRNLEINQQLLKKETFLKQVVNEKNKLIANLEMELKQQPPMELQLQINNLKMAIADLEMELKQQPPMELQLQINNLKMALENEREDRIQTQRRYQALLNRVYPEVSRCAICLETVTHEEFVTTCPGCKKHLHFKCGKQLWEAQGSDAMFKCPLCNHFSHV